MDPLLKELQTSGVGLSVNSFYAGGFLNVVIVDDIRTLATSENSKMKQFDIVKQFAEKHLLKLNVTKCEIICGVHKEAGRC